MSCGCLFCDILNSFEYRVGRGYQYTPAAWAWTRSLARAIQREQKTILAPSLSRITRRHNAKALTIDSVKTAVVINRGILSKTARSLGVSPALLRNFLYANNLTRFLFEIHEKFYPTTFTVPNRY